MPNKQRYINLRQICNVLGALIVIIGIAMLFPAIVSLLYEASDFFPLLVSSGIAITLGLTMRYGIGKHTMEKRSKYSRREGFIIVSFAWVAASIVGSLPFVF
jgi:trk system potassium uptake protein TrkH